MMPKNATVSWTCPAANEPDAARARRRESRKAAAATRMLAAGDRAGHEAAAGCDAHLGPVGWQRLLSFLARSEVGGSGAYERVRGKLLKLFRAKGALHGEELADETFDRVARKLAGAGLGDVRNSTAYVLGVARLVWLESVKREISCRARLDHWAATRDPEDRMAQREFDLALLERCLGELAPDARALLLGYYAHDGRARIETREALVQRFGLNAGLLRTRVHRLRLQLEVRLRALMAERQAG